VAVVNSAICKGCGACVPVCPVDAIHVKGYEDEVIETTIEAMAKEV